MAVISKDRAMAGRAKSIDVLFDIFPWSFLNEE